MGQEEFNALVAKNLVAYRKHNNLTQLELAEKLNYSDKAVSKWERGECLPELYVLKQIADVYGVTVNDFFSERAKPKKNAKWLNAAFVPFLSTCIVWLVALVSFFIWSSIAPNANNRYLTFITALPITAIVFLVFSAVYKSYVCQTLSVTMLIWTVVLTLHLWIKPLFDGITMLYLVAIPVQIAMTLWYIYKAIARKKNGKTK